jgi:hypothetical protein
MRLRLELTSLGRRVRANFQDQISVGNGCGCAAPLGTAAPPDLIASARTGAPSAHHTGTHPRSLRNDLRASAATGIYGRRS